ncbi:MAG: lamin tail domain-containing protein, partial [Thermoanaerobaculia bacterium]
MTRPGAVLAACLLPACLAAPGLRAQVINEIMYHPREEIAPGTEDKRFEWIEIYNPDPDPVDLSGYRLGGVAFTFLAGEFLRGRSYLVVCADEASVQSKYDLGAEVTVGNWIDSALDNSGERITL